MEGFTYHNGILFCEKVPLAKIAAEYGTPVYIYSKTALTHRVQLLKQNLPSTASIYFSIKACSNIHILEILKKLGCGVDIVSGGELFRAAVAQLPNEKIIFSGVGKTEKEISEALKAGIYMFNIESVSELLMLERLATTSRIKTKASLRINPDVDAKTHPHISTGLKKNKFGLSPIELKEIYRHLPSLHSVQVCGLSCHIGSQILTKGPFVQAWKKIMEQAKKAPFKVTHLDLGGGLGIAYEKEPAFSLKEYGKLISSLFKNSPYQILIEPGRALIGPTAVLLTRLIVTKNRGNHHFNVVDAAMNDLMRPALYGATHTVLPVDLKKKGSLMMANLVGPICETADTFQTSIRMPLYPTNTLLAFSNAGAYAMSMASQYNSRPRAPEVLVEKNSFQIIRKRETYADLIQRELPLAIKLI